MEGFLLVKYIKPAIPGQVLEKSPGVPDCSGKKLWADTFPAPPPGNLSAAANGGLVRSCNSRHSTSRHSLLGRSGLSVAA